MSVAGAEDSKVGNCLEQFESEWLENSDPPDFIHYCQKFPPGTVDAREAVCALAMIDLELGWRSNSSPLFRPCTWYLEQLAPWQLTRSQTHELVASEFIVRSRWKDRPQIEEFIATRPTSIVTGEQDWWRRQLRELLDELFPIIGDISIELHHRLRCNLRTPCIVGRQRSRERSGPALIASESGDSWRLIVANRDQTNVSREQLRFNRLSIDQLEVTLLSQNVASKIDGRTLNPNSPAICRVSELGITLAFSSVLIQLRRI